jgi:hypothetical protein
MSYALYNAQQQANSVWERRYENDALGTTGITSGQGYQELPAMTVPEILRATQNMPGLSPVTTNPAAQLYTSGTLNQVLLSASNSQCDTGCLGFKTDPRTLTAKPLYSASAFRASEGQVLPNAYNVVGMY